MPIPPIPVTDTRRVRPSREVAWYRSFSRRSSASRPTNGASRTSDAAATATLGDHPQRSPHRDRCGLALEHVLARLLERDRGAGGAEGRLADEDGARRGDRLDPRGRVDHVARDHALVGGAQRDRRLAGEDARPRLDARAQDPDRVHELERGPDRALGVVLVRGRRAPHGHDRVADELLDHAAVAVDDLAREVEVAGQRLAHELRVAFLGERREADEVGEQHRDEPPFRDRPRLGTVPAAGASAGFDASRAGAPASWPTHGGVAEGRAAVAAEPLSRLGDRAAGRAARGEPRPARPAEALAGRVRRAAARAGDHAIRPSPIVRGGYRMASAPTGPSANDEPVADAVHRPHLVQALVEHERHLRLEHLAGFQVPCRAGGDRPVEVHRPAGPRLERQVVVAAPPAVHLPQPGEREHVAVEGDGDAPPGRRVGQRQPARVERRPVAAEDARLATAHARDVTHAALRARVRQHRPRVGLARRPQLGRRRHADDHVPRRQVDPVPGSHGERRVDPPRERQRPHVEVLDPVARAQDGLAGAQRQASREPRGRDGPEPRRLDRGRHHRPRPTRRPTTARTTARPCTAAARRGAGPSRRSGRSRPSRRTTSRRSTRRTAPAAAWPAGCATAGPAPRRRRRAPRHARPSTGRHVTRSSPLSSSSASSPRHVVARADAAAVKRARPPPRRVGARPRGRGRRPRR